MSRTSIEWTSTVNPDGSVTPGMTWNPVRGCSRVSEGCRNCYAERLAARYAGERLMGAKGLHPKRKPGPFAGFAQSTPSGPRWTGRVELIPSKLKEPLSWRNPSRVFVNSMSDLFHEALPWGDIARVVDAIVAAKQHTFQVLTKRPQRMLDFFTELGAGLEPPPNLWLGVSVEDQATADERIPLLLQTPAAVRFVSYEPGLGLVDYERYLGRSMDCDKHGRVPVTHWTTQKTCGYCMEECGDAGRATPLNRDVQDGLDWVIVGGESGPGARPFDVAWARSAIRQCREAGVACFVKQIGRNPRCTHEERGGSEVGPGGALVPVLLVKDGKGGDPSEWPEDLRVREFPS